MNIIIIISFIIVINIIVIIFMLTRNSYPVLAGVRQRQPAVPRRAPKCLSLFT